MQKKHASDTIRGEELLMMERARRIQLPKEERKKIKHQQRCRCLLCGEKKSPTQLQIHHIIPIEQHEAGFDEYANIRENLCALCSTCHEKADKLASKKIYLWEVLEMEQGKEYPVKKTRRKKPPGEAIAQ